MIKTYFNTYSYEIRRNIYLHYKYKNLSSNRIYVSNGEYKHSNNKITINVYTFNRENYNYILTLKNLFRLRKANNLYVISNKYNTLSNYKPKKELVIKPGNRPSLLVNNKTVKDYFCFVKTYLFIKNENNIFLQKNKEVINTKTKHPIKLDVFFYKKIKEIKKNSLILLSFIKKEKHLVMKTLIINNNKSYLNMSSYITNFYKKFTKNFLKKIKIYMFYRQLMYINKSKYNYNSLQYLTNFLYLIYNKNIEYNFINLKRFYLHSDIISDIFTLKLKNNKTRMLATLSKIKEKIKIKKKSTGMFTSFYFNDSLFNKEKMLTNNRIIKNIKFKYMSGFRLQVKGRLTRRNKAARSVFKTRYKGTLLNINSPDKRLSTVLLKGNLNSNLQFTKTKSKSRIGSFGIKG
jgi:hypothetical protein